MASSNNFAMRACGNSDGVVKQWLRATRSNRGGRSAEPSTAAVSRQERQVDDGWRKKGEDVPGLG